MRRNPARYLGNSDEKQATDESFPATNRFDPNRGVNTRRTVVEVISRSDRGAVSGCERWFNAHRATVL
jgi:hypothetical protein